MWGYLFFTLTHTAVFFCFLAELVKRIVRLKSFKVGSFLYISSTLSLLFALSALLAYLHILTFKPVQYLCITLFPICIYFVQIILLAVRRQRL